jgi:uncharacterized membrane protein YdbT with pleckstrin-like domain
VAISRKLLNDGEVVVVSTRTHVKALLLPALWLILVAAVGGFASSFPSGDSAPLVIAVIWGVALVVLLWLVAAPFLRWMTTTYTLTDRRLITRTGILTRRGHDIPVNRINDVSYEHSLVDRLLGCGTLVVSDASERGQVRLPDVPRVEQVHLQLSNLLFGADLRRGPGERRLDDGS